jgi:hypothetical protein
MKSGSNKLVVAALLCAGALSLANASEYSLKEQGIRSDIPAEIRDYAGGPMIDPDDASVVSVIDFATKSKESRTFEYAYLYKQDQGWSRGSIYVHVQTPLQLIGEHARQQAREYRAVDQEFVDFARGVKVARLAVTEEGSTSNLRVIGVTRSFILLRDGQRVEPVGETPLWHGRSVFSATATQPRPSIAAAHLTEQRLNDIEANYRRAGMSDERISQMMAMLKGQGAVARNTGDIFPIEELGKPGKYEIVFRHPPSNSMLSKGDDEVRVPVSLAGFR